MTDRQEQDQPGRIVVLAFCDALSRRDFATMQELVTDDMTWHIPGHVDRVAFAGVFTFTDILPELEGFLGSLDDFSFTVINSIAEGDSVAVEARSHGLLNGVTYDNVYMMQYKLRDGRIARLQEFLDQSSVAKFMDGVAAVTP